MFVLCVAIRVIQGIAAFLPVSMCVGRVNWGALSAPAVAAGAVSSGMAIGVFADRRLRSAFGPKVIVCLVLLVLTAGLAALGLRSDPEFVITIGFVLGLVVGTDWSTISELARRSLSTSTRWKGIRIWTIVFFGGIALTIVFQGPPAIIFTAAAASAMCLIVAIAKDFGEMEAQAEGPTADTMMAELAATEHAARELEAATVAGASKEAGESEGDGTGEECDATECCGGSKPWQQTSFGHGVLLSTVGWTVMFAGLQMLVHSAATQESPLLFALIGGGFILGAALIFSAAPATGYAVALLPFLIVAIGGSLVSCTATPEGWLSKACLFFLTLSFGAIHCGVKLMTGELFSDCSSDPLRTRVIASSLFAASITVPTVLTLQSLLPVGPWKAIPILLVLISGIAGLRSLPSPVVSSMGEEDPDVPEDELQDVMATIAE